MSLLTVFVAAVLIYAVLWDAFETIVLPRRVPRGIRLSRLYYRSTWRPWSAVIGRLPDSAQREWYLSVYGPLSLLLLLGVWATLLIVGFALLHWGLGTDFTAPEGKPGFGGVVYYSGVTFFTLGFGDIYVRSGVGRAVAVLEGGTGFGFLAATISYLPVLYQAFSQREASISMLDARAGSPPSAGELLRRSGQTGGLASIDPLLHDWERWSAQLLESQLSYPVLAYFRSQHDRQSWLAALTCVLDACTLVMIALEGLPRRQAQLTFAMARHAAVDLSQVFRQRPAPPADRLPPDELRRLRTVLEGANVPLRDAAVADPALAKLRAMYEPYVNALAGYLLMPLPPWLTDEAAIDDWLETPWNVPSD